MKKRRYKKKVSQVEVFRELSSAGKIRVRQPRAKPWGASRRERALVFFTAAILTANVWGFGGTSWWLPTVVTFYAGIAAIAWLLVPLPYYWDVDADDADTTPRANAKRILSFPIFWIGLALLAYMSISGLNPRAQMWVDGQRLWFTGLDHIQWLPSGLKTPFEDMNAWRTVMLYAGPFMLLCALVAGTHHRRSLNVLLYAIVANAVPLAVYGGWFRSQEFSGPLKIYGILNFQWFGFPYSWSLRPFGPILGPNIAAAFLNMSAGVTMALIVSVSQRGIWYDHRRLALFIFLSICLILITVGVVLTASKAGVAICALQYAIWFGFVGLDVIRSFKNKIVGTFVCAIAFSVIALAAFTVSEKMYRNLPPSSAVRIAEFVDIVQSESYLSRKLFNEVSWNMFSERRWIGHGTGTYRYYVRQYFEANSKNRGSDPDRWNSRLTYAHNEYLQFLVENGIFGTILLVAAIAFILRSICVNLALNSIKAGRVILLIPIIGLALHSFLDFPMAVSLNVVVSLILYVPLQKKYNEGSTSLCSKNYPYFQ